MTYNEKYILIQKNGRFCKNKWESSNGLCEKCLEKGIVKSGGASQNPIKKIGKSLIR